MFHLFLNGRGLWSIKLFDCFARRMNYFLRVGFSFGITFIKAIPTRRLFWYNRWILAEFLRKIINKITMVWDLLPITEVLGGSWTLKVLEEALIALFREEVVQCFCEAEMDLWALSRTRFNKNPWLSHIFRLCCSWWTQELIFDGLF